MSTRFISVSAFAEAHGFDADHVRRWVNAGQLPAIRLGRLTLIPEDALSRLLGADKEYRTPPAEVGPSIPRDRIFVVGEIESVAAALRPALFGAVSAADPADPLTGSDSKPGPQ